MHDHGPVLAQFQPTEAAVRDAAEQGQHGGLLQLVLRPLAQVPEQLGVVPRISQALCHIERGERAAQLSRKTLVPALTRQVADFTFRAQSGEEGRRRPRRALGFRGSPSAAQHPDKVPRRLGQQLRPPEGLRPPDHVAQGALGSGQVAVGHQQRGRHAQVLCLADGIAQLPADIPHLIQLAPRELQLAANHADLRASPERLRPERAIPGRLGRGDGPLGLDQRAVEGALLPVADPQVVAALGDALR